jgi:hypothetical protein
MFVVFTYKFPTPTPHPHCSLIYWEWVGFRNTLHLVGVSEVLMFLLSTSY